MRSIARILVLGALAAAAAGCRAPAPSGTARVAIGLGRAALAIPGATRISLEVFGADMPRIVADLPLDGSTALVEVPAGAARVFVVQVYAGRTLTHHGSTVVDLVAGQEQTVTIALEAQQPDTTPPAVVSTSPAGGGAGVPTGASVQVTFSEPIAPASVTASSFTLVGPGGPVAASAIAVSGATATFTPAALAAGTTYTATVTTGVTDLAGNPLAAPFAWSFTTAVPADTTPPAVVSTSPADGATGVPTGAPVQVTFSEAVDPASVTASSFTLAGPGGPVAASAIAVSGATATFTPAALDAGTSYTATVTVAVTDLAGNPLAAPSSWTFTTAVAPPSGYACEPPVQLHADYTSPALAAAVGTSGDVLAVGVPLATQPNRIWARRYRAGSGWDPAEWVSDLANSANVSSLRLVGSEQGDAIAAWMHFDVGGRVTLWARRWDGGAGAWSGAPTLVQEGTCLPFPCTGTRDVIAFEAVIDGAGDATFAWWQDDIPGTTVNVYARRWTRAGGLEPAPAKLSSDPATAYGLVAGAGFGGTVHVLWGEPAQSVARAWRGGAWEIASAVPMPFGPDGLAVDDAGSAIAIDAASGILVVRTPPGPDAWGPARTLWNSGSRPMIAGDGQGRAVAIWRDFGGTRETLAASFDPSVPGGTPAGWTDAVAIGQSDLNDLTFALASNRAGDVLFGANRMDAGERPTASVRAWRPSSGWVPGGMFDVGEAASSEVEGLAVDPDGRATVLWRLRGSGIPFASRCAHTAAPTVEPMVATGNGFAVALRADGTVWAWGVNGSGQLGTGDLGDRVAPVPVLDEAGTGFLSGIVRVAASSSNGYALGRDGTVWAWGSPVALGGAPPTGRPVRVRGAGGSGTLTGASDLAASGSTAYAVRRADGTVWAWGLNGSGQLGDGTTSYSATPVQARPAAGGTLQGVVRVAAGGAHALALTAAGEVWSWGANGQGQCGIGTATPFETGARPVLDAAGAAPLGGIAEVVAFGDNGNSLARDAAGSVLAWGYGGSGLLGSGPGAPALSALPVVVPGFSLDAPPATGLPGLAGTRSAALALRSDGSTWGWGTGENLWWSGVVTSRPAPEAMPAPAGKGSRTLAIATGAASSFAFLVEDDGSIWGWGNGVPGWSQPPPASPVLSGLMPVPERLPGFTLRP